MNYLVGTVNQFDLLVQLENFWFKYQPNDLDDIINYKHMYLYSLYVLNYNETNNSYRKNNNFITSKVFMATKIKMNQTLYLVCTKC